LLALPPTIARLYRLAEARLSGGDGLLLALGLILI